VGGAALGHPIAAVGDLLKERMADACNSAWRLEPSKRYEDVRPVLQVPGHECGGDDVEAAGRALTAHQPKKPFLGAVTRREGAF